MLALLLLTVADATVAATATANDATVADVWPTWRGPAQSGVAGVGSKALITDWSPAGRLWTRDLPGRGGSTPVIASVAGEPRLLLTAAIDGANGVVCLDADGEQLWATKIGTLVAGKHKKGSGANPSVAIAGDTAVAYFKSGDLAGLDMDGRVRWSMNLAEKFGGFDKEALWWDLGTSPVATSHGVVVAVMQSGPSFLLSLDPATGQIRWKTDRDTGAPSEAAQSYTTPVVGRYDGREVLFTVGADAITCHEAQSGRELWRIGGLNPTADGYFRSISSPTLVAGPDGVDTLLAPYARGESLRGVAIGREPGAARPSEPAWTRTDLGSDVPTPTGSGGVAYILADNGKDRGLITAIDTATGQTLGTHRLAKGRDGYSASPVLADDRLIAVREDGVAFVVDVSDPAAMATISQTPTGETVYATPVVTDGRVYVRTPMSVIAYGQGR